MSKKLILVKPKEYRSSDEINRDKFTKIDDPGELIDRICLEVSTPENFSLLRHGHHWEFWPKNHIQVLNISSIKLLFEIIPEKLPIETYEDWDYQKRKDAQETLIKERYQKKD